MLCFFGSEAYGIFASRSRIEPTPPALKAEVLNTGPPGKSPWLFSWIKDSWVDKTTTPLQNFLLLKVPESV